MRKTIKVALLMFCLVLSMTNLAAKSPTNVYVLMASHTYLFKKEDSQLQVGTFGEYNIQVLKSADWNQIEEMGYHKTFTLDKDCCYGVAKSSDDAYHYYKKGSFKKMSYSTLSQKITSCYTKNKSHPNRVENDFRILIFQNKKVNKIVILDANTKVPTNVYVTQASHTYLFRKKDSQLQIGTFGEYNIQVLKSANWNQIDEIGYHKTFTLDKNCLYGMAKSSDDAFQYYQKGSFRKISYSTLSQTIHNYYQKNKKHPDHAKNDFRILLFQKGKKVIKIVALK